MFRPGEALSQIARKRRLSCGIVLAGADSSRYGGEAFGKAGWLPAMESALVGIYLGVSRHTGSLL